MNHFMITGKVVNDLVLADDKSLVVVIRVRRENLNIFNSYYENITLTLQDDLAKQVYLFALKGSCLAIRGELINLLNSGVVDLEPREVFILSSHECGD